MVGDQKSSNKLNLQGVFHPPVFILYPLYYFPVVSWRSAVDLPHLMDNPTG
jgi:hypothetical protein